jgi:hypothetical protein
VVDLRGLRMLSQSLPSGKYPNGAIVRPLGWLDDDTILVAARTQGDDRAGTHLAVLSAPTVPQEDRIYRIVVRSEPTEDAVGPVPSDAVDLMTLEHPTVDRPAPDWPWKEEHRVMLGVGSFLVAWLTGVMWWGRRRW